MKDLSNKRPVELVVMAACLTACVVAAGCSNNSASRSPGTSSLAAPTTSSGRATTSAPSTSGASTSIPATTAPTSTTGACINLSTWTDAQLAALTVVIPVDEADVGEAEPEVAAGAGGVILFGASAPSDLGSQIAGVEGSVPGRIGLLVMTDEEGGGVQRMANLAGNLPWAAQMGAWRASKITSSVAAVARNMLANGVNMDLAPVVDVDATAVEPGPTDPDGFRSFSGTTSTVTTDGIAYMEGLEQGGVIPVLKHFPGLGGSSGNTDDGPAQTLPWSQLQHEAIPPFAEAIDDGAPAVMVSNATVPGLSPSLPASLSSTVIQGELEGTLHFRGLVITDSLSAGAISGAGYNVTEATVKAVEAGADLVLYGPLETSPETDQQFQEIVAAETGAVSSGALPRSRLSAAATAILAARHLAVCS